MAWSPLSRLGWNCRYRAIARLTKPRQDGANGWRGQRQRTTQSQAGGNIMDRRRFIHAVLAGTGAAAIGGRDLAMADAEGGATTRRFTEQRWALDNIIRANGIDWDQPRSIYLSSPCGVEANADFAAIRARVQKMADIGPAFASTAKRREAKARDAEAENNRVTARDNWYMAAIHYGAAEWPYDDSGKQHVELHNKKRECFSNYARLADHKIEAVSIPFKNKSIPGWLHLPPGYSEGKVPVVIAPAANLGPFPPILLADWLVARLN